VSPRSEFKASDLYLISSEADTQGSRRDREMRRGSAIILRDGFPDAERREMLEITPSPQILSELS